MKKFLLLAAILVCAFTSPLYSQDTDQTQDAAIHPDMDSGAMKTRVEKLEAENRDLAAKVDDLEDRVTDLEDKNNPSE